MADILRTTVARLCLATKVYEQAMLDEFFHTTEIIKHWREHIGRFRNASAPIEYFLAKTQSQGAPSVTAKTRYLTIWTDKFDDAFSLLCKTTLSPVQAIYAALDSVRKAREALSEWIRLLSTLSVKSSSSKSTLFEYPGRSMAADLLSNSLGSFRKAIEDGDDIQICMASRDTYLIMYYVAIISPQMWTTQCHSDVVKLHDTSIQKVRAELPMRSIKKRLAFLRDMGPERFATEVGGLLRMAS